MGTVQDDSETLKDLDDSGCVHDGISPSKDDAMEPPCVNLLDLSDDVLLYVLRYCEPRDLKSLGFTCSRLGTLICDRTLWCRVDECSQPTSRARLRWYLTHGLNSNTRVLQLKGYARENEGCMVDENVFEEKEHNRKTDIAGPSTSQKVDCQKKDVPSAGCSRQNEDVGRPQDNPTRDPANFYMPACGGLHYPRFTSPPWQTENVDEEKDSETMRPQATYSGPQLTISRWLLRKIRVQCENLHTLALDYCNIDCTSTSISQFPPKLKSLSLQGTKIYNLPLDKSFMFRIHDFLPLLETLNLSSCDWVEGAALLPISKLPALLKFVATDCQRLAEFVAYASLAARYGFRTLRILDVRRSPLADSELSAFGWLPDLEELYCSPGPMTLDVEPSVPRLDVVIPELAPWEIDEPEYFTSKSLSLEAESDLARDSPTPPPSHDVDSVRPNVFTITLNRNRVENHVREPFVANTQRPLNRAEPSPPPKKRKLENGEGSSNQDGDKIRIGNTDKDALAEKTSDTNDDNARAEVANGPNRNNQPNVNQIQFVEGNVIGFTLSRNHDRHENLSSINLSRLVMEQPDNIQAKSLEKGSQNNKNQNENSESGPSPKKSNLDSGEDINKQKNDNEKGLSPKSNKRGTAENDNDINKDGHKESSDSGPSHKRTKYGCTEGTNSQNGNKMITSDDSSDDDNDKATTKKIFVENGVNLGASTSNGSETENGPKVQKFVKFRRNLPPVLITQSADDSPEIAEGVPGPQNNDNLQNGQPEPNQPNHSANPENNAEPNRNQNEVDNRYHVLYVNVGRQLHAIYQISVESERPLCVQMPDQNNQPGRFNMRNLHRRMHMPYVRNTFYTPQSHIDPSSLITDAALRRFGRSDGEDINYVHIGQYGAGPQVISLENGSRPNKSRLRILVCTGYNGVTNSSLSHLATAAPDLMYIDVSGTKVTEQGVEAFKTLRPDCEIKYGPKKGPDS